MNYQPAETDHVLPDTWVFPVPDGVQIPLLYLAKRPGYSWLHIAPVAGLSVGAACRWMPGSASSCRGLRPSRRKDLP